MAEPDDDSLARYSDVPGLAEPKDPLRPKTRDETYAKVRSILDAIPSQGHIKMVLRDERLAAFRKLVDLLLRPNPDKNRLFLFRLPPGTRSGGAVLASPTSEPAFLHSGA